MKNDSSGAVEYAIGLLQGAAKTPTSPEKMLLAIGVAEGTLRTLAANMSAPSEPESPEPPPLVKRDGRNWMLLGRVVQARRVWLGLTQEAVARAGGPSVQSLSRIETCRYARAGHPTPNTLLRLERVLRWTAGTVDAVLANPGSAYDPSLVSQPVPSTKGEM